MDRVYASTILAEPRIVNYRGKQLKVRAIQTPIEHQQLTRDNRVITVKSDPDVSLANFLVRRNIDTLPAGSHRKLFLRSIEEQNDTEFVTLVYDEKDLFPICNFRDPALNETAAKALQIDPNLAQEMVAEIKTSLFTAGKGHYSRLVRIQNQPGFNFIVDQFSAFEPVLSMIKNDGALFHFVKKAILKSFVHFYLGPSSTGAKYHPIDEVTIAGLVHHSKRVAYLALRLAQKMGLSRSACQEIAASALLHDICKGVKKDEQGNFVWNFHTTADHSVYGAEWLEKILNDNYPKMRPTDRARIMRMIQSVKYHSNIWVDNFDTEITAKNPIADRLVSLADFVPSHKHVRFAYPGAKTITDEEAVNSILANPIDYEWEQVVDNWKDLNTKQKRALFVAYMCLRQFEITEKQDQQQITQAIINGQLPSANIEELRKDPIKMTIWSSLTIANMDEMKIYLRDEFNAVLSQAKPRESIWRTKDQDTGAMEQKAKKLLPFFRNNYREEFWLIIKRSLLDKINSRVTKDPVTEDEFSDELLEALMLKYGSIDAEAIYEQICGLWAEKAKVRGVLKKSSQVTVQATIENLEKVFTDSGYSSTAVTKFEKKLRQALNKETKNQKENIKPLLPQIIQMLEKNFDEPARNKILAELNQADVIKRPRFTAKRIFNRLKAKGIELPDHVRASLGHELDYIQRQAFNRLNKDLVEWLMLRYGADVNTIISALKQAGMDQVVSILQKYEAETRVMEAEYLGLQGKRSIPTAVTTPQLSRMEKELSAILAPGIERRSVNIGNLPEFGYISRFILNYNLDIVSFLKFARDPQNYQKFDYFPEMDKAVALIFNKIGSLSENSKISVYGDYDADGICGTAILTETLQELAKDKADYIGYHIPLRSRGYGPNKKSFEELIDAGYTTFITNDNGISGKEEIDHARQYAKARGIELCFILTDHHHIPDNPPQAEAIIHPKILDKDHPAHFLSGAAVAYKLARALFKRAGIEIGERFLELVAIATITDIVPMLPFSENRALAYFGFAKFNRIFKALVELEKENDDEELTSLTAENLYNQEQFQKSGLSLGLYFLAKLIKVFSFDRDKIGFGLGPVLNAVGRLGDANLVVKLLLTKNVSEALEIAQKLITLNQRRKELQAQMEDKVLQTLEQMTRDKQFDPRFERSVVISVDGLHKGIVGLVAATVSEHIQGLAGVGTFKSGSMRSIPGLHIMKVLIRSLELYRQAGHPDSFFDRFGGHAGAAGYALKPDKEPVFRHYLQLATQEFMEKDESFRSLYGEGVPKRPINIEGEISAEKISASLYHVIQMFSPFGQQTFGKSEEVPRPIFSSLKLRVIDFGLIGGMQDHMEITFEDASGREVTARYFWANDLGVKSMLHPENTGDDVFVDIAYSIEVDHYGRPVLIVQDMRPHSQN